MKLYYIVLVLTFCSSISILAQTDSLKYIDASEFKLIGKGFSDTQTLYERLPARLEGKTRQAVWDLSKNCSGLAIRFRTNSPVIAARWEVTEDVVMNHFAPTGIKGLDLYCLNKGKWQFVHSARPEGKTTTTIIIEQMAMLEREYMLYLPLYDGLANLEIGVKPDAVIESPKVDSPSTGKPIVFYGTSITQGGCASRAGMAYPNILSRKLDREIINLGFSGNGRLDPEIAEALTEIDASCYVIDCLPNIDTIQMKEKYIRFLDIIHDKKPDVPIVMIESVLYAHMDFDQKIDSVVRQKNELLHKLFFELKNKGYKDLTYVMADKLTGDDHEGTVDGVHLTDLGFSRMAEQLYPILEKLTK